MSSLSAARVCSSSTRVARALTLRVFGQKAYLAHKCTRTIQLAPSYGSQQPMQNTLTASLAGLVCSPETPTSSPAASAHPVHITKTKSCIFWHNQLKDEWVCAQYPIAEPRRQPAGSCWPGCTPSLQPAGRYPYSLQCSLRVLSHSGSSRHSATHWIGSCVPSDPSQPPSIQII